MHIPLPGGPLSFPQAEVGATSPVLRPWGVGGSGERSRKGRQQSGSGPVCLRQVWGHLGPQPGFQAVPGTWAGAASTGQCRLGKERSGVWVKGREALAVR